MSAVEPRWWKHLYPSVFTGKKITARKDRSGLQGHRCMSLGERTVRKETEPFVAQCQTVVKPVYVCVEGLLCWAYEANCSI